MGYAAVKYADLKNARLTNYKFNFDDMLSLKGNTAVYLLYAHARIASIVRNAGINVDGAPLSIIDHLNHAWGWPSWQQSVACMVVASASSSCVATAG